MYFTAVVRGQADEHGQRQHQHWQRGYVDARSVASWIHKYSLVYSQVTDLPKAHSIQKGSIARSALTESKLVGERRKGLVGGGGVRGAPAIQADCGQNTNEHRVAPQGAATTAWDYSQSLS